jgi:hypothetical protein
LPHGTGRCACTAEGEDPHCPHHGYEAVIARLRHELAGAVAAARADQREATIRHAAEWLSTLDRDDLARALTRELGGQ